MGTSQILQHQRKKKVKYLSQVMSQISKLFKISEKVIQRIYYTCQQEKVSEPFLLDENFTPRYSYSYDQSIPGISFWWSVVIYFLVHQFSLNLPYLFYWS